MQRILFLLLAIATNLATVTQCRADVLLYDSAPDGTGLNVYSPSAYGNSFQNTAGAGAKASSVTVWLKKSLNASGILQVKLWDTTFSSGVYNKGATTLGTGRYAGADSISASSLTTSLAAYTLTFDSSTTAAMDANGVYMWEITSTFTSVEPLTTNLGNSSSTTTGMNFISNGFGDNRFLMAGTVTAAAVPEPSTLLLGGIAAACGGGGVWWKRRRTPVEKQKPAETPAN